MHVHAPVAKDLLSARRVRRVHHALCTDYPSCDLHRTSQPYGDQASCSTGSYRGYQPCPHQQAATAEQQQAEQQQAEQAGSGSAQGTTNTDETMGCATTCSHPTYTWLHNSEHEHYHRRNYWVRHSVCRTPRHFTIQNDYDTHLSKQLWARPIFDEDLQKQRQAEELQEHTAMCAFTLSVEHTTQAAIYRKPAMAASTTDHHDEGKWNYTGCTHSKQYLDTNLYTTNPISEVEVELAESPAMATIPMAPAHRHRQ